MKRTMEDERYAPKRSRPVRGEQESLIDSLGGYLFYWCKKRREPGDTGVYFTERRDARYLPRRSVTLRAADGQKHVPTGGERETEGVIDARSSFDYDRQEFLVHKNRLDIERSAAVQTERPASTSSSVRRITNSRSLLPAGDFEDPLLRKSTGRFSGDYTLRPLPRSFGASALAPLPSHSSSLAPQDNPPVLRPSGMRRIHYYYLQLFNDKLDAHPQSREVKKQELKGILRPVALSSIQKPAFQPVSKDPCDTRRLRFTQTLIEEKEKFRKKTSMPVRPAATAKANPRLELPQNIRLKSVAVPQKQKYSFSLEEYIEKDRPEKEARLVPGSLRPPKVRDPVLSFGEGRSKQNSPPSSAEEAPSHKQEPTNPLKQPEVRRQPSKDIQITIPTKEEIVESEESEGLKWLPKDAANTAVRLHKAHHFEDAKTPASSPIKPKEKKRPELVQKPGSTAQEAPGPSSGLFGQKPEAREKPAELPGEPAETGNAKRPSKRQEDTPLVPPKASPTANPVTPAFPSMFSNQLPPAAPTPPTQDVRPASNASQAGEQPTKMLNTGQSQPPNSLFMNSKPRLPDPPQASDVDARKEPAPPASHPQADQKAEQGKVGIDFFTSKPFEKPSAAGFFGKTPSVLQGASQTTPAPAEAQKQPPVPAPLPEAVPAKPEPATGGPLPAGPQTAATQKEAPSLPKPSPFFSPLPSTTAAQDKTGAGGGAAPEQGKKEGQPADNPFISLTRGSGSAGSSFHTLLKENKLSSMFGGGGQPSGLLAGAKPDPEPRAGRSSMIDEEKIEASNRPAAWADRGAHSRTFFGSEASNNQASSFFGGRAGAIPSTSHNSFTGHQENGASAGFFAKQNNDSRDVSNPYFRDSGAGGRQGFQQAQSSSSFFGAGFTGGSREQDARSGFGQGQGQGGAQGSLFGTSGPNPFTPGASQRQSLFGNDRKGDPPYMKIKRPSGQDGKNRSLY